MGNIIYFGILHLIQATRFSFNNLALPHPVDNITIHMHPWYPLTRIPNSSVTQNVSRKMCPSQKSRVAAYRRSRRSRHWFPAYRFRQERLNSNSRVAFDHQIVIIIIKIVFGCRNEKKMRKNMKKNEEKKIKNEKKRKK